MRNIDSIKHSLREFRGWRCHYDEAFSLQLDRVRAWQVEALRMRHQRLLDDPVQERAADFLWARMYNANNFTKLAAEVEKALPIGTKVLPDSALATVATALETFLFCGKLDQRIAEHLLLESTQPQINVDSFCAAYRATSSHEERIKQLQLIKRLSKQVEKYVRSQSIYFIFKLASGPALAAGLTELVGLLDEGFSVMRPLGDISQLVNKLMEVEFEVCERICSQHADPLLIGHPDVDLVMR